MNYEAVDDYDIDSPTPRRLSLTASFIAVPGIAILVAGWSMHGQNQLDPMEGIAYWLGIAGSAALLIAVCQSLLHKPHANRPGRLNLLGLLGLAGAAMTIVHTNFQWGAPTSGSTLIAMLLITACSAMGWGLLRRLQSSDPKTPKSSARLQGDFAQARAGMAEAMTVSPALKNYLEQFEDQELPRHSSLIASYLRVRGLPRRIDAIRQLAMKFLRQVLESQTLDEDWTPEQLQAQLVDCTRRLGAYLAKLSAMIEYDVYARLYTLWRILQTLSAAGLILALSAHVYSVHAY